jgi:hypothetical protein
MCAHGTIESLHRCRWIPSVLLVIAVVSCHSPSMSPAAPTKVTSGTSPPAASVINVSGTVSDAAFRPLAGATVQVTDGPGTGLLATTDTRGNFTLFGSFDETTQFRATGVGHAAVTRPLPESCAPCNPHWWIHFSLESLAPHLDLSGLYTLTFLADNRCVVLPDELRTRTFDASITRSSSPDAPTNSRFDVTVHGASTVAGFDRFVIGVAGDYLAADIGEWGHNGAGLVERVGANTYVSVAGGISATVTNTSMISAPMYGAVDRCELTGEWTSAYNCGGSGSTPTAHCLSQNHQLVMRRH